MIDLPFTKGRYLDQADGRNGMGEDLIDRISTGVSGLDKMVDGGLSVPSMRF